MVHILTAFFLLGVLHSVKSSSRTHSGQIVNRLQVEGWFWLHIHINIFIYHINVLKFSGNSCHWSHVIIVNGHIFQGISSYCACKRRNVVCQLKASHEDGGNQKSVGTSLTGNVSEAIQSFPWEKAGRRFVERMIDLGWVPFKWLMPPLLAVSAVREILFTLCYISFSFYTCDFQLCHSYANVSSWLF